MNAIRVQMQNISKHKVKENNSKNLQIKSNKQKFIRPVALEI